MTTRKVVELGATCGTCDNGDRRSFMRTGELFCKLTARRVSTNGVCDSYKHNGANLTQIERRARAGKVQLVVQREFPL